MFMDRDVSQKREFVEIRTAHGSKITVTPAHLLLSTSLINSQNVQRRQKYVFADRIQEGDYLLVSVNGSLVPDRVNSVSARLMRGVYAPLTAEGTIVVDNVVASCYALIDSQFVAHLSFMPIRFYNVLKHWFVGGGSDHQETATTSHSSSSSSSSSISSKNRISSSSSAGDVNSVANNSIDRNLISKEDNVLRKPFHKPSGSNSNGGIGKEMAGVQNGIHWYARALYSIKGMVLPSSWIYH